MNELNNLHKLCVIKHKAIHVQVTTQPLLISQKGYIIKHLSVAASKAKKQQQSMA